MVSAYMLGEGITTDRELSAHAAHLWPGLINFYFIFLIIDDSRSVKASQV